MSKVLKAAGSALSAALVFVLASSVAFAQEVVGPLAGPMPEGAEVHPAFFLPAAMVLIAGGVLMGRLLR